MDISGRKLWYAVYTLQRREMFTSINLRRGGIEVFLPQAVRRRPGALTSIQPLFPRYLFARFQPVHELDAVRYAHGVVCILGGSCTPTPVDEAVIEAIADRLDSNGYLPLMHRPLRAGDNVVVDEGPFRGLVGRVKRELNGGKRVALLLEAIQQVHIVIEKDMLSPAAEY